MGAMDTRIRYRVRPAEPGVWADGLLRPADDHRPRGDGGRRVFRSLPAALAERRADGAAPVAVDRSRAVAAVAQSAHTRCARAKPRAMWDRVPAGWTARGLSLLARASWRDDVLPA